MNISERVSEMIGIGLNFLPRVVGALIVLLVGYLVAKLVAMLVRRSLQRVRLDQRVRMSDLGSWVQRVTDTPARAIARIIYALIMLSVVALAASVLDLSGLNQVLAAVYGYIPQVIAAVLIIGVAGAFAALFSATVQRTMGDTVTGKVAATAVPAVVMTIAAFMALNQLGIARDIVNITFTAIIGSLALGMALAFGLGGREVAGRILEDTYSKSQTGFAQARSDLAQARQRAQSWSEQPEESAAVEVEPEPAPRRGFSPQPTFGETLNPHDFDHDSSDTPKR